MDLLVINFSRRQLGDTSTPHRPPLNLSKSWEFCSRSVCIVNKHLTHVASGLLVPVNYSYILPEQIGISSFGAPFEMGTLNTLSVALPPQKRCVCIFLLLITLNLPALASISQIPMFTLELALTSGKFSLGKYGHHWLLLCMFKTFFHFFLPYLHKCTYSLLRCDWLVLFTILVLEEERKWVWEWCYE